MKKHVVILFLLVSLALVVGASTVKATSAQAGNIHSQPVDEGGSTTSYCGYNEVMSGKIIYAYFPGYVPGYFGWGHYQCQWDDGSRSAAQVQCSWCTDYTHVQYDSQGYGEPFYGPSWLRIGD
jgi:hypothetical protein